MTLMTFNVLINSAAILLILHTIKVDTQIRDSFREIIDEKEEEFDELFEDVKTLKDDLVKLTDRIIVNEVMQEQHRDTIEEIRIKVIRLGNEIESRKNTASEVEDLNDKIEKIRSTFYSLSRNLEC